MTLNKCDKHILTINYRVWVPRTHYFSSNSKIPQMDRFRLIWDYQKMPKWLVLSIGVNKYDQETQKEQSKLSRLTIGDHGLRKTR